MASKRRIRRRRCVGKHDYRTPKQAARDAARLLQSQGEHVEVYRCPQCGGIHLGHRPHVESPSPHPQAKGQKC